MSDRKDSVQSCPDLEKICQRVREKSISYDRYNFSSHYNDLLKAFFDLCQEYDSLDDFNRICIAVPLEMTGFPCALYLVDDKKKHLQLVSDSDRGVLDVPEIPPSAIHLQNESYVIHQIDNSGSESTNDTGGVLDDLIITRWGEDQFFLVVNAACQSVISEDGTSNTRSGEHGHLTRLSLGVYTSASPKWWSC